MSARIFTWAGRVVIAADYTDAKIALGAMGFAKATIYDLTPALAQLVAAERLTGGGDMVTNPPAPDAAHSENQALREGYNNAVARCAKLQAELDIATAQQDKIVVEIVEALKTIDRLNERIFLMEADAETKLAEAQQLAQIHAFGAGPVDDEAAVETDYLQMADAVRSAAPVVAPVVPVVSAIVEPTSGHVLFSRVFCEQTEAVITERFKAGDSWEAIREALAKAGFDFGLKQIQNRATRMGLTTKDRPAGYLTKPGRPRIPEIKAEPTEANPVVKPPLPAVTAKAALPAVVAAPFRSDLSPLANLHGDAVMAMVDEMMNPDEIAKSVNATVSKNDHINAAYVRKIIVEMRAHAKAGA